MWSVSGIVDIVDNSPTNFLGLCSKSQVLFIIFFSCNFDHSEPNGTIFFTVSNNDLQEHHSYLESRFSFFPFVYLSPNFPC